MRNIMAVFLLGIFMLSFSEIHQLMKFPVLIQHFLEHRKEDPNISLLAFLKMHYTGKFVVDDDYQRDNQLPFRTADCYLTSGAFVCECPATIEIFPQKEFSQSEFVLSNEDEIHFLSINDIFQPPRFA